MKNTVLFFCCLLSTTITLHCMELSSPDYKEAEKILINNCELHVQGCLERYKATDNFTPEDMENILQVISFITCSENSADFIHCIKDAQQKGFFQHALQKTHLPIIKWLIEKGNIKHHSTQECVDFIAFCAEQLAPNREKENRETASAILKAVIEQYKANDIFQKSKEPYIETMIKLQLAHRALDSQFTIEEELLIPFLPQDQGNVLNNLSDLYQKITDEQGNTLAHIVVEQHDADELHKLIKKNCVPKNVTNKENLTIHRLAFNKFRAFTENPISATVRSQEAQTTRCCHYMLVKYFADNQKDFSKAQDCCENHRIPKRYDADSEISKSSSSQSISSSSSSSLSQESTLVSQQVRIPNISFKSAMKSFSLSDDGESRFACCWKLLDWCKHRETEDDVTSKLLLS